MSPGISFQELGKLNSNAFDLETILTRAVHRVLNNNLYDFNANSVEKPRHFQGVNNQAHIRLVAEQLCRRVERRYAQKLNDELEKEKAKTERKLNQIREEYSDELEQKKKELTHEKVMLEERMREKERTLQHMMDIRALDKEGSLEIQRKILENRQTELKIAAERLEKANEEFKRRMKGELESLRLEWEKLAVKEAEMTNIDVDLAQARIVQEMRQKIEKIGRENEELRKRLLKAEREKKDLENRNEKTEDELRLTLFRMRDKESLGDSVLVKEILEQNSKLKDDLLKNEIRSRNDTSGEIARLRAEYSNREEAHLLKIKEQQQIIELMNSRLRHLTSEKNYLKEELKETRKDNFFRGGKKEKSKRRSNSQNRPSSSSIESLSSDSSSLSNGSIEISNIKKRMYNLDHIAKQLDASVEIFTATSGHRRQNVLEEDTMHGYDDFCRGMMKNHQSSPVRKTFVVEETTPKEQKITTQTRSEVKRLEDPPPQKVSLPKEITIEEKEPEESDFARRLRERNEQMKSRMTAATLVSEEQTQSKTTTQENPLFQPISSTMADYMSLISQPSQPTAASVQPAEISLPEEVHLDPISKSDDDIDW